LGVPGSAFFASLFFSFSLEPLPRIFAFLLLQQGGLATQQAGLDLPDQNNPKKVKINNPVRFQETA
jgi:hypothetical protein